MGLAVKPTEIIKFLEDKGFYFDRQKASSHAIYKKEDKTVAIPIHAKDLKTGTLSNILRQSGTTKKELEKWLGR